MRDPHFFTELYWFICVVELGSYSAAAEQAGVAKSSLSRRIRKLEERLGVQLLSRSTRKLVMTTIGEEIYRHALDMLNAAHAAKISAEEAHEEPSGLIRVAIPAVLSDPLLAILNRFKQRYPGVRYELCFEDDLSSPRHLDLCLSLRTPPVDSIEVVVRPLIKLQQAFFASPALLKQPGFKLPVSELPDRFFLAQGQGFSPEPLDLQHGSRQLARPALVSPNLQTLKKAAKAGLGIACLPLISCDDEVRMRSLELISSDNPPRSLQLNSQTPSFRGITLTTRHLIDAIKTELIKDKRSSIFIE